MSKEISKGRIVYGTEQPRLYVWGHSGRGHFPRHRRIQNQLSFLAIILKVLRLEVSVYNVYITNQFKTTFARGGG
jgi:hypothetical protein